MKILIETIKNIALIISTEFFHSLPNIKVIYLDKYKLIEIITKKAINKIMINVFLKLNFALPFLSISEVAFWVNISWIGDITNLKRNF